MNLFFWLGYFPAIWLDKLMERYRTRDCRAGGYIAFYASAIMFGIVEVIALLALLYWFFTNYRVVPQ
jgi:hypothetical protein